jgi:hypothetical protein
VGYVAPLIGLSLGALLAAMGVALWDGIRPTPRLAHAIRVIRWGVGGLLLIAILPLWAAGDSALVFSLTLIAAIAAPPTRRRPSPWYDANTLLPVLVLTGTCLFLITRLVQTGGNIASSVSLAAAVYGGLATRVLSEALGVLASPGTPISRLFDVFYLLLTLLVGANALTTLWQRGLVWEGNPDQSSLLGAWLVWSAAWLSPRERPRLRAVLAAMAAVLLVMLALGIG